VNARRRRVRGLRLHSSLTAHEWACVHNARLSNAAGLYPNDGYLKSVAQTAHVSRASSL
jgi:hypothetical protein